jgi:hypothetical protein
MRPVPVERNLTLEVTRCRSRHILRTARDRRAFTVGALLLGAFTAVLVAIGVVAWRFGFRARDEGRGSGVLAAAIGAAIGGMFVLLLLAVLLGRLFGFE